MTFKTPFLDAIQKIPGESCPEKYRWIASEIRAGIVAGANLEEIVESEKFPRPLIPFVQVEAAKALIKTGNRVQSNYEAIAEALKCDDSLIMYRALQASEFFDGSNKDITNVDFFVNYLFPYVSLLTRTKIIKRLGHCLAGKKEFILAEKFFTTILSLYGLNAAVPLLPACSESFILDAIARHKIVLSADMVQRLFQSYPDLIVWYFKLAVRDKSLERCAQDIYLGQYEAVLVKLMKKRLTAFIEIYEKSQSCCELSKKKKRLFFKNARDYCIKSPRVFFPLLLLEEVSEADMEIMFPKMFPDKIEDFNTDQFLSYLKYYPGDKVANLLMKSYEDAYGKNLLDDEYNVTAELMAVLPAEERIKQARLKAERQMVQDSVDISKLYYKSAWRCYLPASEVLPKMREEIAKTPDMMDRGQLVGQMLFCCRVNKDYRALLDILKYIRDRHKNEQSNFHFTFLINVQAIYDLQRLNKEHWAVLFDIIERMHVKGEFSGRYDTVSMFLETALYFRLSNNLSTELIVEIIFTVKKTSYQANWNLLRKYPEYEKMILLAFLDLTKRDSESKNDIYWTVSGLVEAIYKFNEKHVKPRSEIEPLSVKNYPWLCKTIEKISKPDKYGSHGWLEILQNTLKKHEQDMYARLWPSENGEIASVCNLDAFNLLKKDPKRILVNWEKYLDECAHYSYSGSTHRFVRALRWYNDIPIKFAEKCARKILDEKNDAFLTVLASLVHGETYSRFVESLLSPNKSVSWVDAAKNFGLTIFVIDGMKLADPPVPLEFIGRLCEGDYLSNALGVLNVCSRRTTVSKVIPFAKHLSTQRVSVAKHGVRLMFMVATLEQLYEFLSSHWKSSEHYSVRAVVFEQAQRIFRRMPDPASWSLLKQIISTTSVKDESILTVWPFNVNNVPSEYVTDYVTTVLQMIDRLQPATRDSQIDTYTCTFLHSIDEGAWNILPEEFLEQLLRRYLFQNKDKYMPSSRAAASLLVWYLKAEGEKLEHRLNVFSDIFVDAVKNNWNVSDPSYPDRYPVNSLVRSLIRDFAYADTSQHIINRVLNNFLLALTHEADPNSYLLLTYAKECASAETPKDFARKIGEKLPELMHLYTPMFSYCIASALKDFLDCHKFGDLANENVFREVVESLVEFGTVGSAFMAAQLLFLLGRSSRNNNFTPLLKKLCRWDHPAIRSLANYTIQMRNK